MNAQERHEAAARLTEIADGNDKFATRRVAEGLATLGLDAPDAAAAKEAIEKDDEALLNALIMLWTGEESRWIRTQARASFWWADRNAAFGSSWNEKALRDLAQHATLCRMYGHGYQADLRRTLRPVSAKQLGFARKLIASNRIALEVIATDAALKAAISTTAIEAIAEAKAAAA